MIRTLALAVALTLAPASVAFAQTNDAAQAEYVRLSSEMKRLAEKNAWEGVEMTWVKLQENGVAPQYEDWYLAAQAARSAGDVTAARDRLIAANEIREEREVMDWLWEIDSSYGKVSLTADVGTLTLEPEEMPFHPDRAAAVRFAQAKVTETGAYEGYLPEGRYLFGTFEVVVVPRVQTVMIDARGASQVVEHKPTKKEIKAAEAAAAAAAAAALAANQPEPSVEPDPVAEVEPPKPEPDPDAKKKSPYMFGGEIGVGNNFGAIAGAGLQLVFRPGSGVFGLSAGFGYDFQFSTFGFSGFARVYPHKNIYFGAGVAPLIWYRGEVAGEGVAHGPEVQGGVDFLLGPVLIDANIGVGVASAVGKLRPGVTGGVGIGAKFF